MQAEAAGTSYLRDGVLCEGQVLHQDVQAFVLLVQELPDPSVREIRDIRVFHGLGAATGILLG